MADTLMTIAQIADKVSERGQFGPVLTSISSQATKSTYYFPILISKNVSLKTANLLSQNLEYMYGYFMRACFAMTPAISVQGDVNVEEYLKRFHQNTGIAKNKFGFILKEAIAVNPDELKEFRLISEEPLNEAVKFRDLSPDNKEKIVKGAADKGLGVVDDVTKVIRDAKGQVSRGSISPHNDTWQVSAVEKKNNMAPSVMTVSCQFLVKGHDTPIAVQIPVGIKTIIHPVEPDDINYRVADQLAGSGNIKNFIRWTSGEVESLGDVLFGTTRMKKNITGDKKIDQWFDVIERRKRINKLSLGLASKKPFLPNMTLILSTYDVEDIEQKTKFNILKNHNATQRLLKECFLLSLVIVDEADETAYILYDGHNDFEEVPFNTIKRENDKTNDVMSDLIKTLAGR